LPFILTERVVGGLAARGTTRGTARNCDVVGIMRVTVTFANRDRRIRAPPYLLDRRQSRAAGRDQTGSTNPSNPHDGREAPCIEEFSRRSTAAAARGSRLALDEAISLARESGGLVIAMCVVSDAPRLTDVDSGYVEQRDPAGLDADKAAIAVADAETAFQLSGVRGIAQTVEANGQDISDVLARAAAECDADLIVMGTHGRRGVRRAVLGSVAEALLRDADRPVLVVREGPGAGAGML